jgi:D-sedoheptulose 7-phosphate isomerase
MMNLEERYPMDEILNPLIARHPQLQGNIPEIRAAFETLSASFRAGGKLLVCGNGGSASDSEHIVGELMKGYLRFREVPAEFRERLVEAYPRSGSYLAGRLQGALPAISLVSQVGLITATSNDIDPDMIFAQQVYGYGRPGDVLLGISTSGKSANVILAMQVASALGLRTIALTGGDGGELRGASEIAIAVPGSSTAEIQENHMAVYHALCALLEEAFFS